MATSDDMEVDGNDSWWHASHEYIGVMYTTDGMVTITCADGQGMRISLNTARSLYLLLATLSDSLPPGV